MTRPVFYKPLIIPIFIPHMGCPHQCAFCNQHLITTQNRRRPDIDLIHETITSYLGYGAGRSHVEVAFFGGNFLGLNQPWIEVLLGVVTEYIQDGRVHGIRFSTRPDTIDSSTLGLICNHRVTMIELGIQSMDDRVLEQSARGHTARENRTAIRQVQEAGISVGVQLMTGLPGESLSSLEKSTRAVAALGPDVARIYPLLVFDGSPLADRYRKGTYQPLGLEEAVRRTGMMYRILTDAGVRVIRMGLQASEAMDDPEKVLAGPWHPAFGHLVLGALLFQRCCDLMDKADVLKNSSCVKILVHPRSESRLRGEKNRQFEQLKVRYPGVCFLITPDDTIPEKELALVAQP